MCRGDSSSRKNEQRLRNLFFFQHLYCTPIQVFEHIILTLFVWLRYVETLKVFQFHFSRHTLALLVELDSFLVVGNCETELQKVKKEKKAREA